MYVWLIFQIKLELFDPNWASCTRPLNFRNRTREHRISCGFIVHRTTSTFNTTPASLSSKLYFSKTVVPDNDASEYQPFCMVFTVCLCKYTKLIKPFIGGKRYPKSGRLFCCLNYNDKIWQNLF